MAALPICASPDVLGALTVLSLMPDVLGSCTRYELAKGLPASVDVEISEEGDTSCVRAAYLLKPENNPLFEAGGHFGIARSFRFQIF